MFVGNAGISKIGPTADVDVDGWSAMIDVNLRGVLHGIAAALPVFRRQGHGDFVTVVSTAGIKIVPNMGVYAATKNAVRTCSRRCVKSRPTASSGPRRSHPATSTPSWTRRSKTPRPVVPPERPWTSFGMPPEAVARAIAFAIGQPRDVEIGDIVIRPTRQG